MHASTTPPSSALKLQKQPAKATIQDRVGESRCAPKTDSTPSLPASNLRILLSWILLGISILSAQTQPSPQPIPFATTFGTTSFSTLPSGLITWNGLSGDSINTLAKAESSTPNGNATVSTQSAPTTTGGSHGLSTSSNARFYIQTSSNTTNGANQLALALNTTGQSSIILTYDLEVVSAQPRTIGIVAQFRIGTTGPWTTLTPSSGSNPFSHAGGTTGIKSNVSCPLPTSTDNQPNIQIRWAVWRGSEGGTSSGIAIDNIQASATSITNTLSLTITLYTISESSGNNAALATITTASPVPSNLAVTLTSDDLTEATIATPATRIIPAGQSSVSFPINAANDDFFDQSQTFTLQASAPGTTPVTATLTVTDDEDSFSPPPDHYASTLGLDGDSLKAALHLIASTGHTPIIYGSTLAPLRTIFADPADSNRVISIYSGTSIHRNDVFRPDAQLDPNLTWSREHLWPDSYGLDPENINPGSTNGDAGPDYTDLFNLRPCVHTLNSQRSNRYYDTSSGAITTPLLAPLCSYDTNSWEPRETEKGDIARAMFYMATRYDGGELLTLDLELSESPSTTLGRFAKLSTLLRWHTEDPVDLLERERNQRTFTLQGNRNPFVDQPDFIARVWVSILLDKLTATVTEGATTDSYTIVLASQPSANVTLTPTPSTPNQITASPTIISFTPANWNIPQTVTLTAIDDPVFESTLSLTITHDITTTDPRYAILSASEISVTVTDNDPLIQPIPLPVTHGGPWSPLPTGFLGTGAGTYTTSLAEDTATGSARFDDTNDQIIIAFNSPPAQLSYALRGNLSGSSATEGTFLIQQSADGETFTTLRTVTNKNNSVETYSDSLSTTTRYVAFLYQTKTSGNIQLDALTITAATLTPWQSWLNQYQLTGNAANALADDDQDSIALILEFILGGHPNQPDSNIAPHLTGDTTAPIFTFLRSDASLTHTDFTVQWSDDLTNWNNIPIPATSSGNVTVITNGASPDEIRVALPPGSPRYARLVATVK